MQVLHWLDPRTKKQAPHEMRLIDQGGDLKILFLIEKEMGRNNLEVDFARLSLSQFMAAWQKQDGNWIEVDYCDKEKLLKEYSAIRYVALPDGKRFIVWRFDHRQNVPYDTLGLFKGTVEKLREFYARKEKLIA